MRLSVVDSDADSARLGPRTAAPGMTDRLLVASAARGDSEAFGALVDRWIDRLFALAYRILRD